MKSKQTRNFVTVSSLKPCDFVEISYSSPLLLSISYVATCGRSFDEACGIGFDDYFCGMYDANSQTYVRCYCSLSHVKEIVRSNVLKASGENSLDWNFGFTLGWLSALALTHPPLAAAGLEYLHQALRALAMPFYFPLQFREPSSSGIKAVCNSYVVLIHYAMADGCTTLVPYRGPRTGKPVEFSRLSDAHRLCDALNDRQQVA